MQHEQYTAAAQHYDQQAEAVLRFVRENPGETMGSLAEQISGNLHIEFSHVVDLTDFLAFNDEVHMELGAWWASPRSDS